MHLFFCFEAVIVKFQEYYLKQGKGSACQKLSMHIFCLNISDISDNNLNQTLQLWLLSRLYTLGLLLESVKILPKASTPNIKSAEKDSTQQVRAGKSLIQSPQTIRLCPLSSTL